MTTAPADPIPSDAQTLTSRRRFLDACHCRAMDRPPVWLMRQAGRALPEYRALKQKYTFLQLVQTPDLAAEVTLQPIRRFGFDAAILFSDILIAAEGLGQSYKFRETGGIEMAFAIRTAADIAKLDPRAVAERLSYIPQAVCQVKTVLGEQTALIGFAGSPWTLANFMIEGGSAETFTHAAALFRDDPKMFAALMEKISAAVVEVLRLQIAAGVDAVQIFDTLGGQLPARDFTAASCDWIRWVIAELKPTVPVIVFAKGAQENLAAQAATGANVLGMDWTVNLAAIRAKLPENIGVQGNLDPRLLLAAPEKVAAETKRILTEMRGLRGHIFNLGHGVPPESKLESIAALVETVRDFR